MTDTWYLLRASSKTPEGPLTTDALRALIDAGTEPGSQVAAAGTDQWTAIEDVPEIGGRARPAARGGTSPGGSSGAATGATESMRRALATTPARTPTGAPRAGTSSRWTQAAVVLLGLLLVTLGVATYLVDERIARAERDYRGWHEAQLTTLRDERAAERTADIAWQRGAPRKISEVSHECVATMSEVTCSFTNLGQETVTTCAQGLLMQKEAAGVRLYSAPVCSGPVAPRQTVSKGSYWDGGRANDVCRSASGYLDWQKCDFTVIDFEGGSGK